MRLRSLLFVPADSERKLAKAARIDADALILDLEDAVASDNKPAARERASAFLRSSTVGAVRTWVRINALDTPDSRLDLAAILAARPYGLVVPKVDHPAALARLGETLHALEAQAGIASGTTRLIAMLETPRGLLTAADYLQTPLPRLDAIAWGAEDLAAALDIGSPRDADGEWGFSLCNARLQCLLLTRALDVAAIETVTTEFRNLDALRADCLRARAAGMTGKLAIHPDQISVINSVFTPSTEELAQARHVIAAFTAAAGTGAVSLNGTMLDLAHLRAAQRLLRKAGVLQ